MEKSKLILTWLLSENKIGNRTVDKLLDYFKSLENIWDNLCSEKLNLVPIISLEVIDNLIYKKNTFEEMIEDLIYKNNVEILTVYDEKYPKKLKNIPDPPYVLYCKGNIDCLDNISIGIVGSRKATDYGKWCANKFSKELTSYGITIISGMAVGIDAIAHYGAIDNNGNTIGVLGCGIDLIYPSCNKTLYSKVINSDGAIISEYFFGCKPFAYNFPARNRIISGLSSGILVVEAQEKSGTLITCSHAAEQGRDVFAVPGSINSLYSVGTNKLIKDGGKIVMCVEDILEELREYTFCKNNITQNASCINNLSEMEQHIINEVMIKEMSFDELKNNLSYSPNELLCNLTFLEMKGLIVQNSGKKFVLSN